MARVLVVALRFWPAIGGVETRTWEVARRLADQHRIAVVTSDLRRERPLERFAAEEIESEAEGLEIERLPAVRRLPIDGYGVHLAGLRRSLREKLAWADVVDLHPYGAAHTDTTVWQARRARVPVALTTHFHPPETAAHPTLRVLYDRVLGGPMLRRADRVIAITDRERCLLAERFGIAAARLAAIPGGVDTRHFRDLKRPREPGLLLCVGRLAPVKGFDLAIGALAGVRGQGIEARLVLAGEDWGEATRLRRLASDLGASRSIEFAGRVDAAQRLDLYNRAQALLVPSRYESFGITALEAVACGCPAVVSDTGGLAEAAGPAGRVVPRTEEAFAEAAAALLRDPVRWAELSRAGADHAARHDWDRVAAAVDAVWRELAR